MKNGIGFGHIRRALLVAAAIADAGRLHPVVISQAGSLALHRVRDPRVNVVNFPLLHRLPSAVTEDCYTDLLDALLRQLDPAVVVEDTYPDPRYGALPALRDVPRLLLLRRLDGLSFDQIRTRGGFARYRQILVAQTPEVFAGEGHSGDSVAAVIGSGRFNFVGDIAVAPAPAEVEEARTRCAPDGQRLVVVAAGAGGDQMPDGYAERLFTAARHVADRLHEGHPDVRFLLVTGPYYAGQPIDPARNVAVRRFEPDLAALFQAAHVAVIKPGNNSLTETLYGLAHLVLVPDVSFMERVDRHAARVATEYGVVAQPNADQLETHIRKALATPARQRRLAPNLAGIARVVDAIHCHAAQGRRPAAVTPKQLLLVLRPPPGLPAQLPEPLRAAAVIGDPSATADARVLPLSAITASADTLKGAAILVDVEPPTDMTPADLAARGVTLLLTQDAAHLDVATRWLRLNPPSPSLLTADLTGFHATPGSAPMLTHRIATLLEHETRAGLLIDLAHLDQPADLTSLLHGLAHWLADQPLRLTTLDDTARTLACSLLEPI